MSIHPIRSNRYQWARQFAVLVLLGAYVCPIKISQSAIYDPFGSWAPLTGEGSCREGELNLLTYNIAGLPELLSGAKSPRASSMVEIGVRMAAYDIINVQEDFHYHKELYRGANKHPYRTAHQDRLPYGDGLNTLSRYPILFTKRVAWLDCSGADCLAAKGFSLSRIMVAQGVTVDVYNVHANSEDNPRATLARRNNMKQLAKYIAENSDQQALLLMGDFNAHYAAAWDKLHDFVLKNRLTDAWVVTKREGRTPPVVNDFTPPDKLGLTDSCESIDKIFFRNSAYLAFTPCSYKIQKQYFSNRYGQPLSDHCAVSLSMKWKRLKGNMLLNVH
ncbi:endonuclease/exonuclease/phosphatase family protein [Sphingobacterium griseoflavum]|uniref:Endonuclease/exonuclease/phosphatase domain-containing protein n=1 Tax=Sphingobacterium griseoflavum TaxID=1474952 RepID=A0ABQ3HTI8_9SPHI|nr:endonuclease/exonuclease/phosphatase family protein [Sphingobacterium griseoflavum]GHE33347.1 hypothetical protein GCM10017764_15560 [Sphingobacterium griseoflavum]